MWIWTRRSEIRRSEDGEGVEFLLGGRRVNQAVLLVVEVQEEKETRRID